MEANRKPDAVAAATLTASLLSDLRRLIDGARQRVATAVNAELTLLYWHVGRRINDEVLRGERAEYGKQVVAMAAAQLMAEYGRGWGEKHLRHCMRLEQAFPDEQILYTLCRELSWSHIRSVMFIDDPLKRDFYIEVCRLERWAVRQLQERIQSMLYERTAISRKPEETIRADLTVLREEGRLSPDIAFRDPYVLDFLGLADTYAERDLESAILADLQRFIIELGSDFAFLARQKRIAIDNRDYYIDLLFYHRRLRCLVAIDLKIGDFEAAFKGQMELYLRYLEKHERVEGESAPIGLILCAGKSEEHVELLQLHHSNIRVAEYLTLLPPREVLQAKLHQSIELARQRLVGKVGQ
ncbi:MAG: PDDEXK nuclease domain-containing protein [Candidatus Nitricoxidivorans perseverans]|uniref:PDDEXK nuclease domain-containing protein n=1 Tax=Candidatus Nitricoxidivorans perseverans TaxID=2975601 RepID=A0AA49FJ45_9PROT|nr:MAG: PDDEXK nuclease domain-containing protein [Candidatus Nitricoxidivorans perseverans]